MHGVGRHEEHETVQGRRDVDSDYVVVAALAGDVDAEVAAVGGG